MGNRRRRQPAADPSILYFAARLNEMGEDKIVGEEGAIEKTPKEETACRPTLIRKLHAAMGAHFTKNDDDIRCALGRGGAPGLHGGALPNRVRQASSMVWGRRSHRGEDERPRPTRLRNDQDREARTRSADLQSLQAHKARLDTRQARRCPQMAVRIRMACSYWHHHGQAHQPGEETASS